MKFEIYQWLVPIISLFFISRIVIQYRRKKRSLQGALIWSGFWIILIVLAIIPNEIATEIGTILGFKDKVNAVIFVALGLLFLFVFYLSSAIERLEYQLTELVRKIAFNKEDQKKK